MPVEFANLQRHHILQLLAVIGIVPLQFLLTAHSSESLRQYHVQSFLTGLSKFRKSYLDLSEWRRWCSYIIGAGPPQDFVVPDAVRQASDNNGHFAGSYEPRSPRPPHVKYRVGHVVRHKFHKYRGIIIGWDETAKAPESFISSDKPGWREMPNYAVLVDTRDRFAPQMTYVPEENIEVIQSFQIYHPLLEYHFEGFDGAAYIMRPWLRNVYPFD